MYILGLSFFYHDSAAALVKNGEILAAAQEERFTRKKHDPDFPTLAIEYCLKEAGIGIGQIDLVVFYEKPFLKFERLMETYLAYAPVGLPSFLKAAPIWLKEKFWIPEIIKKKSGYTGKIIFPEHHEAHAAAAFFPSPFERAAFLTVDGVGEWATTSYGVGDKNNIKILSQMEFPHSLGLLYSAFTYYTGFKVNSGEYKLMGLAPYGEAKYVDLIMDNLIDLKEDGSFRMNMKYFNYPAGLTMTNDNFHKLFGGQPRQPESALTQKEMDIAQSIQTVTENILLKIARHIKKETGEDNLCLSGGVALNCVANGKILREKIFKNIWIQPAAGDAGSALGAALIAWYQYLGNARIIPSDGRDSQKGSYLGPQFSNTEIKQFLDKRNVPYEELEDELLFDKAATILSEEKVIGWFQGRMEFGPRALGGRSIIGDARSAKMQSEMNLKIKFRESFRPFAPSVLADKASEYFDIEEESPYMLLVADVEKDKRLEPKPGEEQQWGIDKLNQLRSMIPAVTHVDYSARLQTVNIKDNPRYYKLIEAFYKKTGCPVIVNTSFNVRGEPIVCTPEDAYLCFMRTNMDYLIMENIILDKSKQPVFSDKEDWRQKYELD